MSETGPSTADRREDKETGETAGSRTKEEAEAEEDAEEVESEWHVWILAAIVVAGIVLIFAPSFFLPELLGSLGVLLVAIGVIGWVVKWTIERSG